MRVTFYSKPKLNKRKSEEAGRPIYDEVDMVKISLPGDRKTEPHFPAHEQTVTFDGETGTDDRRTWAERFPAEFKAYKVGAEQTVEGTPIAEWAYLTAAKRAELKALDIVVVEQIAQISDRNLKILGSEGHQLKAQAQAFIDQARETAAPTRLAGENAALREEIERLRAEMSAPKRGRPRKDAEAPEAEAAA